MHVFSGYGIELEYMIVDQDTLSVLPIADKLLERAAGDECSEFNRGFLGWSNEMTLHVFEIKNPRPTSLLRILPAAFQDEVQYANKLLQSLGARLMPTAMHPWMNPRAETRLWPHENRTIYDAYARIFDTRSHGWANLQSMHINLPFADDGEFERLHAAIRLALPIVPALAASSPIADQQDVHCADYRMRVYCDNSDKVPSIAGMVIPETMKSRAEYEEIILAPMYRDIAPFDPEGILRHEWLNSRGAIARFDRNAIEIRVTDVQECPRADLAIAAAVSFVVKTLYRRGQTMLAAQQAISTEALARIFQACIRDADQAVIDDGGYLALFGFAQPECRAQELWRWLIERMLHDNLEYAAPWKEPLQAILTHGPLARRIIRAIDSDFSRPRLETVYRELCDCLRDGRMFMAFELDD